MPSERLLAILSTFLHANFCGINAASMSSFFRFKSAREILTQVADQLAGVAGHFERPLFECTTVPFSIQRVRSETTITVVSRF